MGFAWRGPEFLAQIGRKRIGVWRALPPGRDDLLRLHDAITCRDYPMQLNLDKERGYGLAVSKCASRQAQAGWEIAGWEIAGWR